MSDIEREEFEKFWREEMNTEVMDLEKTKYPMIKPEDQQYLCHETNRAWITWQAARQARASEEPVAFMVEWDDGLVDLVKGPLPEFGEDPMIVTPLFTHPPAKVPEGWRDVVQRTVDALSIMDESEGIAGWHLNGDVSPWDEGDLPAIRDELEALLTTPTPETEWVKCPEIVRNALFVLLEQYDCENITDGVDSYGDVYASEWLDQQFTTIRRFLAATEIAAPQEQ